MAWRTALATIILATGVLLTGETMAQTRYPAPVVPDMRPPGGQIYWDETHKRILENKLREQANGLDQPVPQPQERNCGQLFQDCNIAGWSANFCSQQFDLCNASGRR
jgi:hypothetical protein